MVNMKRIAIFFTTTAFVAILTVSFANAQNAPLGDLARQVRKQKPAPTTKTFDNDNMPKDDKVSVVGQAPEQSPNNQPDTSSGAASSTQSPDQPTHSGGTANNSASGDQKSSTDEEQAKKQALSKEWQ